MPQDARLVPVVSAAWLAAHAGDVRIVDSRWYLDGRSGLSAYRAGHIPAAAFVDLDRWLAAPASSQGGRHPLPAPEVFAEGMARAGIADTDPVVAYDDAGGTIAARVIWMLRAMGHAAALLDGGIGAWTGPLETGGRQPAPAVFHPLPWPEHLLATIDEVAAPDGVVLDARSRARYRGEGETVDPRAGHIPGSLSLPCRENMDADGRFLPPEVLRRTFAQAGITPVTRVIFSCGSGVTACPNLLALELAGLGPGRLFPGSWSQWSRDAARPVATGDAPDGDAVGER